MRRGDRTTLNIAVLAKHDRPDLAALTTDAAIRVLSSAAPQAGGQVDVLLKLTDGLDPDGAELHHEARVVVAIGQEPPPAPHGWIRTARGEDVNAALLVHRGLTRASALGVSTATVARLLGPSSAGTYFRCLSPRANPTAAMRRMARELARRGHARDLLLEVEFDAETPLEHVNQAGRLASAVTSTLHLMLRPAGRAGYGVEALAWGLGAASN